MSMNFHCAYMSPLGRVTREIQLELNAFGSPFNILVFSLDYYHVYN